MNAQVKDLGVHLFDILFEVLKTAEKTDRFESSCPWNTASELALAQDALAPFK